MTSPPQARGSVRYVKLDDEPTAVPREVRVEPGTLERPGDFVWVKVERTFVRCLVTGKPAFGHDLLVTRATPETEARFKCICQRGFVCEDHPLQHPGHGSCRGATRDCMVPNCPWWAGMDRSHLDPP